MIKPCKYGTHRVIKPIGTLPQAAEIIDATPIPFDNEMLIDVDTLNIDSASFHQIKNACDNDIDKMKTMIQTIVKEKGKMQNPVTKSGGMLMGTVKMVGEHFHDRSLTIGTKIATLVSLSLTPLRIDEIVSINLSNEQVKIRGSAILFDSGIYAVIPDDLEEKLVLAALDVAGAPAQVEALAKTNDTVFVIGAAGKSGILCGLKAKEIVGKDGKVIGLVNEEAQVAELETLNIYDAIVFEDAQKPLAVYQKIVALTEGKLADLTLNVVNVENTEMTAILATKDKGIVYYFSMATAFTKAALGAEGIGKDVTMIIGNGYTNHHVKITLDLIRNYPEIQALFKARYA